MNNQSNERAPGRENSSRPNRFQILALLALILVAMTLRLYRLAAQDLWGDEAFSIYLSWQPLAQVIAGGADTHPPFYPALLFFWLRLVGESAFATRALSALVGILIVPLVFLLGRRIANARVAWFSAIPATVSPLLIYYSQETRMYELVTVLMCASCLTALSLLPLTPSPLSQWERGEGKSKGMMGVKYFFTTLLAMYTHYSAFYVWIAQNVFVTWHYLRTHSLRRWVFLQLALIFAYVPWIIVQTGFLSGKSSARVDEWSWRGVEIVFGKTLLAFSAGMTIDPPLAIFYILLFALLFLLGITAIIRKRVSDLALFAPLYFLVPVIIAFAVNPILPFFFERYVLVALPGFYLTAALGLDFIARTSPRGAIAMTSFLVALGLFSLSQYYFNDAYAKGKYGQMMAFVSAHAQPGDALVLNNPLQKPLSRYYQPRGIPAYFLPDGVPLEDPSSRAQLEQIVREHSRIWLVQFGNPAEFDPTNYLPRYLGANAYKSFSQGFVDSALSLYLTPLRDTPAFAPVRAQFGESIQLTAYSIDRVSVTPRGDLRLTLQWRAAARIEKSYKVFAHLIGGYNPATESPVWAQMDGEPVGGTHPTNQWQPGELIEDRYGLILPDNIPPGEYLLEIGMYDPVTGARLAVRDETGNRVAEDRIVLAKIRVSE